MGWVALPNVPDRLLIVLREINILGVSTYPLIFNTSVSPPIIRTGNLIPNYPILLASTVNGIACDSPAPTSPRVHSTDSDTPGCAASATCSS